MKRTVCLGASLFFLVTGASAYEFAAIPPVDLAAASPAVAQMVLGDYLISDQTTQKNCKIRLLQEKAPNGMVAAVNYACKYFYPVMAGMKTWRYLQNGTIDFIDDDNRIRVRLSPENGRFVIAGDRADVAGMDQVIKLPPRAKASGSAGDPVKR